MLEYIVIGLLAAFVYLFILTPLIPMIRLKLQFGKDCKFSYSLFGGEVFNAMKALEKSGDLFQRSREEYRKNNYKIYVSNFLWRVRLAVVDPEYYKVMLLNHQYYPKVNIVNHDDVLLKGLVWSMGDKWKQQRALLGVPFEYDQLKSRLPMINQVLRQKIAAFTGDNVLELLELITGQVVIRSFFGQAAEGLQVNNREIQIEIAELLNDLSGIRFKSKYQFFKRFLLNKKSWKFFPSEHEKDLLRRVQDVRLVIEKLIQKRIMQIELKIDEDENEVQQKEPDFLDIQIQEYLKQKSQGSKSITIDEIIQQFITLFFAGTDTTALLTYHCLYFFAEYPEFQEEIRQEIQEICQEQDILENKLPKLVKLTAFINEVLRMKNPAIRIVQRIANQTHYVNDLKIEKGWLVLMDYYQQCYQEKYFENPLEFNYKRWLEKEPVKENNNYVYIPFSAGPRNCIGQHMAMMESKIILSQILRQFEILKNPNVKPRWTAKFLYQLTPGNAVILNPRQK